MEIGVVTALKPLAELGLLAVLVPLFLYMLWAILKAHNSERKEWLDSHKEEASLTRETVNKNTAAIENLSNALMLRGPMHMEAPTQPKKRASRKKT